MSVSEMIPECIQCSGHCCERLYLRRPYDRRAGGRRRAVQVFCAEHPYFTPVNAGRIEQDEILILAVCAYWRGGFAGCAIYAHRPRLCREYPECVREKPEKHQHDLCTAAQRILREISNARLQEGSRSHDI